MTNDHDDGLDPEVELEPVPEASAVEPPEAEPEPAPGWLARLKARLSRPAAMSRETKSSERTRGLVALVATTFAAILLCVGLFTTDSDSARKERRTTPNLGRPQTAVTDPDAPNRSPVPQLSVNQQPNEESGELSEQDLLGTMRNRGTPAPVTNPPPPPPRQPRPLASVNFSDPALEEAYRRQGFTPPTPSTPVPPPPPSVPPKTGEALRKSSLVYVRSTTSDAPSRTVPTIARAARPLLPQGSALVARLQHSVSSAAKVPVTAVIEYNYEHDGQLVVPAGTKAFGELAQATPQGWVSLRFHALELPNGEREQIDGSALSMDRGVLRGDVNGKNTAKKFLTRALTGVGTIAAFAVGGRGLSGGIDNSVLLRERLASNVALAGEQEMAMLAYQQNIVVSLPANTRFRLVLHEAGVSRAPQPAAASQAGFSQQELQEMIRLRDQLREMTRLMQTSAVQDTGRGR